MSFKKLLKEYQNVTPEAKGFAIEYDGCVTEYLLVVPDDVEKEKVVEFYWNFETHTPIDIAVFVDTETEFKKNCNGIYRNGFNIKEVQNEATDN